MAHRTCAPVTPEAQGCASSVTSLQCEEYEHCSFGSFFLRRERKNIYLNKRFYQHALGVSCFLQKERNAVSSKNKNNTNTEKNSKITLEKIFLAIIL